MMSSPRGRRSEMNRSYPRSIQIIHWILSRMGIYQSVLMFMWLAERTKHNKEPPFSPWLIYAYATIGMLGSTGLSARFLASLSLYALSAEHLHLAYLFIFETKLGYSQWLRIRVALRSLAAAATYLRVVSCPPGGRRSKPSGSYFIGQTLLTIFTTMGALSSLPFSLIPIDRNAQMIEEGSSWDILAQFDWYIGICLFIIFSTASFLLALPILVNWQLLHTQSVTVSRLPVQGDRLTLLGLLLLCVCRDSNMNYWIQNGSEFWLQAVVLLNSIIAMLGIAVTSVTMYAPKESVKVDNKSD